MLTIASMTVLKLLFFCESQLANGTEITNKMVVVTVANFKVSHKGSIFIICIAVVHLFNLQYTRIFYKSLLLNLNTGTCKIFPPLFCYFLLRVLISLLPAKWDCMLYCRWQPICLYPAFRLQEQPILL